MAIQTLYVQKVPMANEGLDLDSLNQESRDWFNELEKTYHRKEIEYQRANSEEVPGTNRLEALLDNALFQRLEYARACAAIGITDLESPRLTGMMPTSTLKSWQVTGINALLEFEEDKHLSACVVADSTGLGKTIQTIGY